MDKRHRIAFCSSVFASADHVAAFCEDAASLPMRLWMSSWAEA
eukprot:COSAG01_NODE_2153_length_8291_cov_6.152832_1_plen_43_part_00